MTTHQPAVDVRGLRKRYGPVTAVDGIDLTVTHGEVFGILGPNGAGKSTLFNTISGFLKPEHGRILFHEEQINHLLPYERVAAGIGRTFQHVRLFRNLTVYENLLVAQHRHLSSGAFAAMFSLSAFVIGPAISGDDFAISKTSTAACPYLPARWSRESSPTGPNASSSSGSAVIPSGISCVRQGASMPSRSTTRSTASFAIRRQVVSFPPVIVTRPELVS